MNFSIRKMNYPKHSIKLYIFIYTNTQSMNIPDSQDYKATRL